jgi:biopolymer transport protein ExbB
MDVTNNIEGISILEQGGIVIYPILLLGIVSIILAMERILYIRKGQIKGKDFIEGIKNLLRKKRLMEALTICEEHSGPIVNILKSILLNTNRSKDQVIEAIQTTAQIEITLLERRLPILALIVNIAPTIGLLGSFLSVYTAFSHGQQNGPYLNSSDFSGILASALISTIVGILVGLIAQIFYSFLTAKIRSMIEDMEWTAHNLTQFILSKEYQNQDESN